ncbi:MAG: hypothetical protein MJ252_08885 [archaeon]|nr:hypothetical protein [archaeon]
MGLQVSQESGFMNQPGMGMQGPNNMSMGMGNKGPKKNKGNQMMKGGNMQQSQMPMGNPGQLNMDFNENFLPNPNTNPQQPNPSMYFIGDKNFGLDQ